jgi:hypothetical protein
MAGRDRGESEWFKSAGLSDLSFTVNASSDRQKLSYIKYVDSIRPHTTIGQ